MAPIVGIEIATGVELVEKRPDDFIGKTVIVAFHLFPVEADGLESVTDLLGVVSENLFEVGVAVGP
jgi:tRNA-binding EMAP/Myf-like protein